jgi:hypothetical protein
MPLSNIEQEFQENKYWMVQLKWRGRYVVGRRKELFEIGDK